MSDFSSFSILSVKPPDANKKPAQWRALPCSPGTLFFSSVPKPWGTWTNFVPFITWLFRAPCFIIIRIRRQAGLIGQKGKIIAEREEAGTSSCHFPPHWWTGGLLHFHLHLLALSPPWALVLSHSSSFLPCLTPGFLGASHFPCERTVLSHWGPESILRVDRGCCHVKQHTVWSNYTRLPT